MAADAFISKITAEACENVTDEVVKQYTESQGEVSISEEESFHIGGP